MNLKKFNYNKTLIKKCDKTQIASQPKNLKCDKTHILTKF